jgi:hypothetical protein
MQAGGVGRDLGSSASRLAWGGLDRQGQFSWRAATAADASIQQLHTQGALESPFLFWHDGVGCVRETWAVGSRLQAQLRGHGSCCAWEGLVGM